MNNQNKFQDILFFASHNSKELFIPKIIADGYSDEAITEIIFSHSFLKAFFGEGYMYHDGKFADDLINNIKWECEAKKLVLIPEDKRVDYLYNFIKEEK